MLADAFAKAVDRMYSTMGQPCTHTALDGAQTAVTAIIAHDLQRFGNMDLASAAGAVSVRLSELPMPQRGDRYEIEGKTYVVSSVLVADELEHTALVS